MVRFSLSVGAIALCLSLMVFISLVKADPSPGISVTVTAVDDTMQGLDHQATFTVTTTSITTETEHVVLTVTGLPSGWTYTLTPDEFDLAAGATQDSSLEITGTVDTPPGDYPFTAEGEATIPALPWLPPETASYTDYVYVLLALVIPEVPLGTITSIVSMLGALIGYKIIPKRLKRKDKK